MNFGDPRLPERFWEKCIPEPNSGCWIWIASLNDRGYGQYELNYKVPKAHRVAYVALVGEHPKGLELDHKCRTRCCVNPAHLEPVTHDENMRRAAASRAFCRSGHPYSGDNLYFRLSGDRRCRACDKKSHELRKSR